MTLAAPLILTLNGGSSSIKFALFQTGKMLRRVETGRLVRIGLSSATLEVKQVSPRNELSRLVKAPDYIAAVGVLMDWLIERGGAFAAVGHRLVHGGPKYSEPERITPQMVADLGRITEYDPDHLPEEIQLLEAAHRQFPGLPQVACFDTAFHRELPTVARMFPLPRRYQAQGIRRYGFHGLSYAFLMEELALLGDRAATTGRVILAHLGSGASLAAVRDGKSIDTSMGFTPAAGLVMGTRTGDLDPGLVAYFQGTEKLTARQFQHMVNQESGLLGVSEISADMQILLRQESGDVRAAEAIALFCYQAKKWIGAFTAALGGLDTLVFAGGIGEHAPPIRARICDGLGFLGIELSELRNRENASAISTDASRVTVRVIPTDEELMIARSVVRLCPSLVEPPRGPGLD